MTPWACSPSSAGTSLPSSRLPGWQDTVPKRTSTVCGCTGTYRAMFRLSYWTRPRSRTSSRNRSGTPSTRRSRPQARCLDTPRLEGRPRPRRTAAPTALARPPALPRHLLRQPSPPRRTTAPAATQGTGRWVRTPPSTNRQSAARARLCLRTWSQTSRDTPRRTSYLWTEPSTPFYRARPRPTTFPRTPRASTTQWTWWRPQRRIATWWSSPLDSAPPRRSAS